MTAAELRKKYFDFFLKRGHILIPPAPLVPDNDPTTLFTSSGMQPLVPYLLGQPHPSGKRLVDSQPSFRGQGIFSDDSNEVGNTRHTTFFEMLGNWSLGEYFKKDQLRFFFTFLTDKKEGLGLDPHKLYVTVFSGNEQVPKDLESIEIWKQLFLEKGIEAKEGERIVSYGVEKNWWSRSGSPQQMPIGEIGGPDSEVFFDFGLEHDSRFGPKCHPNCDCSRFLEIGNSVFIQYQKQSDGSFRELPQKNVDFGGGLERQLAAVRNDNDIFKTDLFLAIIKEIEKASGKSYTEDKNKPVMRVIADHLKAASFLIKAGVLPSNKDRGYVLRRLLRRAAIKMQSLAGDLSPDFFSAISESVIDLYSDTDYFDVSKDKSVIGPVIKEEITKFSQTLDRGLKEFQKLEDKQLNALSAFNLYQTYGFPLEVTEELFKQKGKILDRQGYENVFKGHQELSKKASVGMFRGGLADHSEQVVKYHTTTHLLHAALRKVLGDHVNQVGSNLTVERLRFDFTHPDKLTEEQLRKVEKIVNEKIAADLPVRMEVMSLEEAKKAGALAFFEQKYSEKVKVYTVGPSASSGPPFSKEVCGGPHVKSTGEIGGIEIYKEEAVGGGKRRIYARIVGTKNP